MYSKEMQAFLRFLREGIAGDKLTNRLAEEVDKTKKCQEWEREYMTLEVKLSEAKEEGRQEGRQEEQLCIARSMMEENVPIDIIKRVTKLDEATLRSLMNH